MVRCRNHRRVPWKISRGLLFAWQTIVTVDSDFVAGRATRMSTIGVVHRLQTSVGLNVSECEFHVLVCGAAHGLGLQAYKRDLGIDLPLIILESDRSISKALVSRRGVGKQRHVQTRSLCKTFLNSNTLLQLYRLKLTAVYCNRRGCVSTTPQMTCFRGAKVCRIRLQGKVTINSYSLTTS